VEPFIFIMKLLCYNQQTQITNANNFL